MTISSEKEKLAWDIFYGQSKASAVDCSSTMVEDYAFRLLSTGKFTDSEMVYFIGERYRQCDQVAQENLNRMKKAMDKLLKSVNLPLS